MGNGNRIKERARLRSTYIQKENERDQLNYVRRERKRERALGDFKNNAVVSRGQ